MTSNVTGNFVKPREDAATREGQATRRTGITLSAGLQGLKQQAKSKPTATQKRRARKVRKRTVKPEG